MLILGIPGIIFVILEIYNLNKAAKMVSADYPKLTQYLLELKRAKMRQSAWWLLGGACFANVFGNLYLLMAVSNQSENLVHNGYEIAIGSFFIALIVSAIYGTEASRLGKLDAISLQKIREAAWEGDLYRVKSMLDGNPSLVFSNKYINGTPLHYAAEMGHMAVVELLLANEADVNARSQNGATPLHAAVLSGKKDVLELLLANGANYDEHDNDGMTPLHYAAENGNREIVESMLTKNVKVDAKDNCAKTPLHLASESGSIEIVELLLAHQALVNSRDKLGNTPMRYANIGGHKDVVEVLHRIGGHE